MSEMLVLFPELQWSIKTFMYIISFELLLVHSDQTVQPSAVPYPAVQHYADHHTSATPQIFLNLKFYIPVK